jgi:hypothetical protein
MRNRNNKYFSPSSFEQILNNGEIEELLHILAVTGQTSYLRLPINNCEKTVSRTDYTLNKDCLNVLSAWCALHDDNRI